MRRSAAALSGKVLGAPLTPDAKHPSTSIHFNQFPNTEDNIQDTSIL